MKHLSMAAVLAMATTALAQDPNRNRMNDSNPDFRQPTAQVEQAFDPSVNRMNVRYAEGTARELTGAPSPTSNRMNQTWSNQAPAPKPVERRPVDPEVTP